MDYFATLTLALLIFVLGVLTGRVSQKYEPPVGFTCTQSQIIDGKAECVEYRRTEK